MCGIAGWAGTTEGPAEEFLAASCGAMVHRGPDSEGRYFDRTGQSTTALGARRLAIIDLAGGDQPVQNEDGTVAAVLNGEIYNFEELRRELDSKGHAFTSSVDTEVLVHAYEEWGDEMLPRLNGMFALAVWDAANQRLLLARDRFGKKPLFWTEQAGGLRFASELKALLADGAIRAAPDYVSLWALLALQYIPPHRSPIRDVSPLPPAHALTWEAGKSRTWRWWDLWSGAGSSIPEARPEELLERLDDAVVRRLKADVPLGVFLSGGIDSSLVAASMAKAGGSVKTFSVGFEEADYSELPLARRVSEACGTDHTEIEVSWRDGSLIPELLFDLDEPLADSSALPTFLVSRAAASELKVVLSGDGGDELFGGYERYPQFARWNRLWRLARSTRSEFVARPLGRASVGIRPGGESIRGRAREVARRAGVAMRRASEAMPDRYLNFLGAFPTAERLRLAGPSFSTLGGLATDPISAILGARWPLREDELIASLGALDIESELAGDILVKVDRMSMANSLEVRSPFLDHDFAVWALKLPDSARLRDGRTKSILRDAALLRLPQAVADAPKRGFGIPLSLWLQTGLRPTIENVLLDPKTSERGLFDEGEVKRLIDEHRHGRANAARIWMLFAIELWCRSYLDSPRPTKVTL